MSMRRHARARVLQTIVLSGHMRSLTDCFCLSERIEPGQVMRACTNHVRTLFGCTTTRPCMLDRALGRRLRQRVHRAAVAVSGSVWCMSRHVQASKRGRERSEHGCEGAVRDDLGSDRLCALVCGVFNVGPCPSLCGSSRPCGRALPLFTPSAQFPRVHPGWCSLVGALLIDAMGRGRKQPMVKVTLKDPSKDALVIDVNWGDGKTGQVVFKDPEQHITPADDLFLVPAPPSPLGAGARTYLDVHTAATRHRDPTALPSNEYLCAVLAAQEKFLARVSDMDEIVSAANPVPAPETRIEIKVVDEPEPWSIFNAFEAVDTWDEAVTLFQSCPAAERSVTRVSKLNSDQLDAIGRLPVPKHRPPMTLYFSYAEFWIAALSSDGQIGTLILPLPSGESRVVTYDNSGRRVPLAMFVAGAEVGDLATLFNLSVIARDAATKRKRPDIYAAAVDRYLPLLEVQEYQGIAQDVCCYALDGGESHESAVLRGVPGSMRAAVRAYKRATDFCARLGVHHLSAGFYSHMWNCLGLALKRVDQFDMAERAYLWGLLIPQRLLRRAPKSAVGGDLASLVVIRSNLALLSRARQRSDDEKADATINGIKNQQPFDISEGLDGEMRCNACGIMAKTSQLKCCSRCSMAHYCNAQCQKEHWKEHKPNCVKCGKAEK